MATYEDHRCSTCRHSRYTRTGDGFHEPLSYDVDCQRDEELSVLVKLGKLSDEDFERVGHDLACPLWESEEIAVCPRHGAYGSKDGCGDCEAESYAGLYDDGA